MSLGSACLTKGWILRVRLMAMLVVEEVELPVTLVKVLLVGIFWSSPRRQCSVVQREQT